MRKLGSLLLATLVLSGCDAAKPDPDVYPVPAAEALARLQKADLAGFRQAENCGLAFSIIASPAADGMKWRVSTGLVDVASFAVRLEPQDDTSTRAVIEVDADPQGGEIYDGTRQYDRPALEQPLRPALTELVDAAMEQRPFDSNRMPSPQTPDTVCLSQRTQMDSGTEVAAQSPQPAPQSAPPDGTGAFGNGTAGGLGQPANVPTSLDPTPAAAPGDGPAPGAVVPAPLDPAPSGVQGSPVQAAFVPAPSMAVGNSSDPGSAAPQELGQQGQP